MINVTTRRQARVEAFELLFQSEMNERNNEIYNNDFTKELVLGVKREQERIDSLIEKYLINWTLDRISLVDKAILRLALYELIFIEDIPHAVSINEAIELAHKYGDENSSKFINGILSKIIQKGDTTQ